MNRLLLAGIMALSIQVAHAGDLTAEGKAVTDRCLQNAAKITNLKISYEFSGIAASGRTETVLWDKPGKKLKWSRAGVRAGSYLVNSDSNTLSSVGEGGTVFEEPLDQAQSVTLGLPFPGWLWNPAIVIPAAAVEVRRDGADLVLASSKSIPRREVWLDATTGCLHRLVDTDRSGVRIRTVELRGWTERDHVWVPGEMEERIQGKRNTLNRTTKFTVQSVNAPLSQSEFALP